MKKIIEKIKSYFRKREIVRKLDDGRTILFTLYGSYIVPENEIETVKQRIFKYTKLMGKVFVIAGFCWLPFIIFAYLIAVQIPYSYGPAIFPIVLVPVFLICLLMAIIEYMIWLKPIVKDFEKIKLSENIKIFKRIFVFGILLLFVLVFYIYNFLPLISLIYSHTAFLEYKKGEYNKAIEYINISRKLDGYKEKENVPSFYSTSISCINKKLGTSEDNLCDCNKFSEYKKEHQEEYAAAKKPYFAKLFYEFLEENIVVDYCGLK